MRLVDALLVAMSSSQLYSHGSTFGSVMHAFAQGRVAEPPLLPAYEWGGGREGCAAIETAEPPCTSAKLLARCKQSRTHHNGPAKSPTRQELKVKQHEEVELSPTAPSSCGYAGVPEAVAAASAWHGPGGGAATALAAARGGGDGSPAASFRLLGPQGPPCAGGLSAFGQQDDEKRFCMHAVHQAAGRRVLWSIGCNNEFGFEQAAFDAFDKIYVFDCTLPNNTISAHGAASRRRSRETTEARQQRQAAFDKLLSKLTFFPVCLSAGHEGRRPPPSRGTSSQLPGHEIVEPASRSSRSLLSQSGHPGSERQYATYAELLALTGECGALMVPWPHAHCSFLLHFLRHRTALGSPCGTALVSPDVAALMCGCAALSGEPRGPELLKMDIEGWEWAVLSGMLRSVVEWPAHARPSQIAFELHLLDQLPDEWLRTHPGTTRAPGVPYCPRRDYNRHCAKSAADVDGLMRQLYRNGFMLISARKNRRAVHCHELLVAQVATRCGLKASVEANVSSPRASAVKRVHQDERGPRRLPRAPRAPRHRQPGTP